MPNTGEACSLGLAPTTSAIATLSIGDAIAITISERKKVTQNNFAEVHPAGKLGKMLTPVFQVMHTDFPTISEDNLKFSDLLSTFIKGRFGIVGIINKKRQLVGIISDADLRKIVENNLTDNPAMVINKNFHSINKDMNLGEAAKFLKKNRIVSCFVLDEKSSNILGLLSVYDVLGLA